LGRTDVGKATASSGGRLRGGAQARVEGIEAAGAGGDLGRNVGERRRWSRMRSMVSRRVMKPITFMRAEHLGQTSGSTSYTLRRRSAQRLQRGGGRRGKGLLFRLRLAVSDVTAVVAPAFAPCGIGVVAVVADEMLPRWRVLRQFQAAARCLSRE